MDQCLELGDMSPIPPYDLQNDREENFHIPHLAVLRIARRSEDMSTELE